jgi:hypothetical protein
MDLRTYVEEIGGKPWRSRPISSAKFVKWLLADEDSEWHRYQGHKVSQWDIGHLFREFYEVRSDVVLRRGCRRCCLPAKSRSAAASEKALDVVLVGIVGDPRSCRMPAGAAKAKIQ